MGAGRVRVLRARLSCQPVIFVFSLIAISVVLSSCAKRPRPVIARCDRVVNFESHLRRISERWLGASCGARL